MGDSNRILHSHIFRFPGAEAQGEKKSSRFGKLRASFVSKLPNVGGGSVGKTSPAMAPARTSGLRRKIRDFFSSSKSESIALKPTGNKNAANERKMARDRAKGANSTNSAEKFKPLSEYDFEGDWHSNSSVAPPKDVMLASVHAGISHFASAKNLDNRAANNFLRGNQSVSATASIFGAPMRESLRDTIIETFTGTPILAFRKGSYPSGGNFVGYGEDAEVADENASTKAAVDNLEAVSAKLFGTDPESTAAAAAKVPQDLCDALAVALDAIDQSDAAVDLKEKAKSKTISDFLFLRTINPAIATASKDQSLSNCAQRNILEFQKVLQTIANGVSVVDNPKEPLHENVEPIFKENNTEEKIRKQIDDFSKVVIARANGDVVKAANSEAALDRFKRMLQVSAFSVKDVSTEREQHQPKNANVD